jgi:hypothetical protein
MRWQWPAGGCSESLGLGEWHPESVITVLESAITVLESVVTVLESVITVLESVITVLESVITVLGTVTHDFPYYARKSAGHPTDAAGPPSGNGMSSGSRAIASRRSTAAQLKSDYRASLRAFSR